MNTTDLRKVGGPIMLAIPPALLDVLDLRSGAEVSITIESGDLIVKPRRRRRYTLEQLLAKCDSRAARPPKDREWATGGPTGRELI